MGRESRRVLAIVIGLPLVLGVALPAVAAGHRAAPPLALRANKVRTGDVVPATTPSAASGLALVQSFGTVSSFTDYNSANEAIDVVHAASSGFYQILFRGLGFLGGDAQVSAVSADVTCAVNSWGTSGPDLVVNVNCYDTTGTPADATFYVLATRPNSAPNQPHGVFDYDLVYKNSGKLTGAYQYNSSHQTNSVTHPATGEYVVRMPGPGVTGDTKGTVKVSAFGPGAGSCQVASWKTTTSGELIGVRCFSATGMLQDRQFTVVYARGNNLMGQNGKVDANAFASGTQDLYEPKFQFDSKAGARVSVAHLDVGTYEVLFVGTHTAGHQFPNPLGNLMITPVANAYRRCGMDYTPFSRTPTLRVICTDAIGSVADSRFTVQFRIH